MEEEIKKDEEVVEETEESEIESEENVEEKSEPNIEKEESKIKSFDKQLYWTLGIMIGLIAIFIFSYSVFQSMQSFEYNGLSFTTKRIGDIPLYHYYYSFTNPGVTGKVTQEDISTVNLYLRTDPRENEIPVEGTISPSVGRETIISINTTNLVQCEYTSVALSNLAIFLNANFVPVKSGTTEVEIADQTTAVLADCTTHKDKDVILIQEGKNTEINKENSRCYVINVNNCEILPAIEKFQIQSIIDARARQKANNLI